MVAKSFFWMLEMTVVNSYIIYQHTLNENREKTTQLAFQREIIEHLVEPILSSRLPTPILSPAVSQDRLKHKNSHYMEKRRKRKDCVVCSDRNEGGVRHLTLFICTTCTDNPTLCPGECFHVYHTQKHYKTL